MKFGLVPDEVAAARPWAPIINIGPPPGQEDVIGSLECQVDDSGTEDLPGVRVFRFYVELEDGDLERIQDGRPIEFAVLARQMVPVSIALW